MMEIMSYKSFKYCRKCSVTLALLLILQSSFAQYNFSKADDWMLGNLNELGGRAVLVLLKDGNVIYEKTENNLSGKQKMIGKYIAKRQGKNADDILADWNGSSHVAIASCSKWLSASLVMTFVDEGKLNLNDSIGKFLPVFTQNKKGQITIWQCLSHLTAINPGNLKESRDMIGKGNTMDEVMEKIAQQPLEGEPGKVFRYSSVGLQIAAAVIEKISNKDFKTLFKERIVIPCGMINTDFGNSPVPLAAGGAYSTPEDYIHFLQMILQNGNYNGKQILSKESVANMQKNYTKDARVAFSPAEAGDWGYGFGEWTMDNVVERSDAITSPGLFGSFPWVDNKKQYAGFLMVFNLKQKGRRESYQQLKKIVDNEIDYINNISH